MFDHRLGLALGRTVAEIHTMSFVEYQQWKTYYMLEPWGFHNQEYYNATLLAQIRNVQASKKSQMVKATKLIRDMPSLILQALRKKKDQLLRQTQAPVLDMDNPEDRAFATEQMIKQFETIFGKRLERKDK